MTSKFTHIINWWKGLKRNISNQKTGLIVGISASLIVSIFMQLSGVVTFSFLNKPNFTMLETQKHEAGGLDSIQFNLHNNSSWTNYESGTVFVNLYLPVSLIENDKKFTEFGPSGPRPATLNEEDINRIVIDNAIYIRINSNISLQINKKASVAVLRITGNFESGKKERVYYTVITPRGLFPRNFEIDDTGRALDPLTNLPHIEFTLL